MKGEGGGGRPARGATAGGRGLQAATLAASRRRGPQETRDAAVEATDGEAWAARATRELRRLLRLDGAGEEERGAANEAADGEAWAANATRELRRLLGLEVGGQEGP